MEWLDRLWALARKPGANRVARVRAFFRIAYWAKEGDPRVLGWLDKLAEKRGWKVVRDTTCYASLR